MLTSTARDYIDLNKIDEYKKLIFKLIDETRKEKGNIMYELFYDKENEGEFIIFERWENEEALKNHFESDHFKTIVPQIQKIQSKPSVVNLYHKLY